MRSPVAPLDFEGGPVPVVAGDDGVIVDQFIERDVVPGIDKQRVVLVFQRHTLEKLRVTPPAGL